MEYAGVSRRWNPWTDLLTLQDEMNRLFQATMGPTPRAGLLATDYLPAADVIRDKDNVVIRLDVPGLKKEDLDISVLESTLVVRGEKKHEPNDGGNVHRSERFYGSFERVIDLPTPVNADQARATFCDGVLEITCPVREEAKPRQIAIDVTR